MASVGCLVTLAMVGTMLITGHGAPQHTAQRGASSPGHADERVLADEHNLELEPALKSRSQPSTNPGSSSGFRDPAKPEKGFSDVPKKYTSKPLKQTPKTPMKSTPIPPPNPQVYLLPTENVKLVFPDDDETVMAANLRALDDQLGRPSDLHAIILESGEDADTFSRALHDFQERTYNSKKVTETHDPTYQQDLLQGQFQYQALLAHQTKPSKRHRPNTHLQALPVPHVYPQQPLLQADPFLLQQHPRQPVYRQHKETYRGLRRRRSLLDLGYGEDVVMMVPNTNRLLEDNIYTSVPRKTRSPDVESSEAYSEETKKITSDESDEKLRAKSNAMPMQISISPNPTTSSSAQDNSTSEVKSKNDSMAGPAKTFPITKMVLDTQSSGTAPAADPTSPALYASSSVETDDLLDYTNEISGISSQSESPENDGIIRSAPPAVLMKAGRDSREISSKIPASKESLEEFVSSETSSELSSSVEMSSEAPESSEMSSETSESSEISSELSGSVEMSSEAPESSEMSSETSESSEISSELSGSVEMSSEAPESSEMSSEILESSEISSELSDSVEMSSEAPESSEMSSEISESSEISSELSGSVERSSEAPESSEISSELSGSVEMSSEAPESSEMSSEILESSESTDSSEVSAEAENSAEKSSETQEKTEMSSESNDSSEMSSESPESSEVSSEYIDSSESSSESSNRSEKSLEDPESSETRSEYPDSSESPESFELFGDFQTQNRPQMNSNAQQGAIIISELSNNSERISEILHRLEISSESFRSFEGSSEYLINIEESPAIIDASRQFIEILSNSGTETPFPTTKKISDFTNNFELASDFPNNSEQNDPNSVTVSKPENFTDYYATTPSGSELPFTVEIFDAYNESTDEPVVYDDKIEFFDSSENYVDSMETSRPSRLDKPKVLESAVKNSMNGKKDFNMMEQYPFGPSTVSAGSDGQFEVEDLTAENGKDQNEEMTENEDSNLRKKFTKSLDTTGPYKLTGKKEGKELPTSSQTGALEKGRSKSLDIFSLEASVPGKEEFVKEFPLATGDNLGFEATGPG
ncbi:hypothetical protein FHG87_003895 [Trinorchestia longiramus]|nr:hypothetical protein FHG87_003895 [Trinorchestia longiramus]